MADLVVKDGKIFIDGKATQIISGAMHYFRIHPGLWRDRLLKAKQCGLNCVETYMCWNLHEPCEGRYDFSGMLDFEEFIRQADEIGLMVMVRPGPYICAEWDNGGFPAWLMAKERIRLRCMNDAYISALTNYLNVILPKLAQLQSTKGGPIVAMQVENEYGSYGNDH
ncbi:MAG: beta-galactosidase, partial [Victivallaceae bacterium]